MPKPRTLAIGDRPKAFSYVRFSTPDQAAGDSERRQLEGARRYAEIHDLELDESLSFKDLGVSGFHGRNAETGQLRAFLRAVEEGFVPSGSYLLVESLDRISRKAARKALRVLEEIVEAGVTVVTLSDNKTYTAESLDGMDLMMALLVMLRAHEESATKALRVREARGQERKRAREGTGHIAGRWPGWLNKVDGRWEVIPERVEILREIFAQAAGGAGIEAIARSLNKRKVETWGAGKAKAVLWSDAYIRKILGNRAVLGELTPHLWHGDKSHSEGRRTPEGEAIPNYYPAAITPAKWAAVQVLRKGRVQRRRLPAQLQNILGGLATCSTCGGSMVRVWKGGAKSYPSLVCRRAKTGGDCAYISVRYDAVEESLISYADKLLSKLPAGSRGPKIDTRLEELEAEQHGLDVAREELRAALRRGFSPMIEQQVRESDVEAAALREEYRQLEEERALTAGPLVQRRSEELRAALTAKKLDRTKVNGLLRQLCGKVTVRWQAGHNGGLLTFHWRHGGHSSAPIWPTPRKKWTRRAAA